MQLYICNAKENKTEIMPLSVQLGIPDYSLEFSFCYPVVFLRVFLIFVGEI